MEVLPLLLQEYVLPGGKAPFSEWLENLGDIEASKAINRRLIRIRLGNLGDCKYFESHLELRIDYGPGYRIYCGRKKNTIVVLLIGGTKKSQEGDIQTAKYFWADYQKRFPS